MFVYFHANDDRQWPRRRQSARGTAVWDAPACLMSLHFDSPLVPDLNQALEAFAGVRHQRRYLTHVLVRERVQL